AVATACFTQNRSIIRLRHGKTPYELMHEKIKSFSGDVKERKAKREVEEIETLNLELDHKEKVLMITALKEQLNKLKGKAVLIDAVSLNPIDPALQQVDVASLVPKLRKNRIAHTDYIRQTQKEAATLKEIVESERLLSPLNTSLDYASYINSVNASKKSKSVKTPIKRKVVQIVLWYLDSGCSKHMTGDRSQLINFVQKFLGMVKFGNDHVAKIMGYRDYQNGNGLVPGLPKLKFEKGHLCSACAMGKSTKKTHKPKSEDTNQEKLYLLHIDLYGPMQAVATACFTQNRSIIRLRHGKTPYELMHGKQPDLSFFHVFGALCYPTNNSENVDAEVIAPIAEVIPQVDDDSTSSPSSTTVDQDAPSPSKSPTPTEI
nr:integrase, catalytic region, zinc finger, CCHC-type, peptidase aspartic, catalytic [Tanacetum cinerariifolium]